MEVEGSLFPYLSSTKSISVELFQPQMKKKRNVRMLVILFHQIRNPALHSEWGESTSGSRQRRRPGTLQGTPEWQEGSEYRLFSHQVPCLHQPLPSSSLPLARRRQLAIILLPGV